MVENVCMLVTQVRTGTYNKNLKGNQWHPLAIDNLKERGVIDDYCKWLVKEIGGDGMVKGDDSMMAETRVVDTGSE